jgi:hypothetical protein
VHTPFIPLHVPLGALQGGEQRRAQRSGQRRQGRRGREAQSARREVDAEEMRRELVHEERLAAVLSAEFDGAARRGLDATVP